MTASRLLYSGLLWLLQPLAWRRLARENLDAASARQRRGDIPLPEKPVIWVHCASVGEVLAVDPLLRQLVTRHPQHQLVVTTMTATGGRQLRQRLPKAIHYLLPLDLPGFAQRFIQRLAPAVAVIFETELWPNLFAACQQQQIPLLIINGRLSEKHFSNYRKLRPLLRDAFSSVTHIAAKSAEDAERFMQLGADANKITVTGNIKFDLALDADIPAKASLLRQQWGTRPVWIAASTHEGEDAPLLAVHDQLLHHLPDALLLLAPRHPRRAAEVTRLIETAGLTFARRSLNQPVTDTTQVYLCDTLGELLMLYAASDLAFVAGSLVDVGGHNCLEPAALGIPMITGPDVRNFAEVVTQLQAVDGIIQIQQTDQLAPLLQQLLQAPQTRQQLADAALQVVAANRGALQQQLALIEQYLPPLTGSRP